MMSENRTKNLHSMNDLEANCINNTIDFLLNTIRNNMYNVIQYQNEYDWHRRNSSDLVSDAENQLHVDKICGLRKEILESIQSVIKSLIEIENTVIHKRLYNWKINQMYGGYGDRDEDNVQISKTCTKPAIMVLDEIQMWFDQLNVIIKETIKIVNFMCINSQPIFLNEFKQAQIDINHIHRLLIESSLIIEKHPPQVIKKDLRFDVKLRCLLSREDTIGPLVTVSIFSGLKY